MTISRFLAVAILTAVPGSAGVRTRAVAALPHVTLTVVVRDAGGTPVVGAIVHSGSSISNTNGTGADGKYSIMLPGGRTVVITVDDFAFETVTVTFTPAQGA